ncbi:MAG TPA: adenylate/guanylate cyclase domain-containing protein [Nocardioidaceae bacterium]|nr:adenylate/guanylate cyclase domain-containing protein [Nocardioidaceae bacterium]
MALVQRFMELDDWPASRKVVLLMEIVLPAQAVMSVIVYATSAASDILDRELFGRWILLGVVVLVVPLILSLLAVRAGAEGRWLPYLLPLLYGTWITLGMYGFGLWSTWFACAYPLVVMIWAIWLGGAVGWFGVFCCIAGITLVEILQATGVLRYAPFMVDRGIDAQHSGGWIASSGVAQLGFFLISYALVVVVLSARKLQEAQLAQAHHRLDESNHAIRRYIPTQVAEAILAGDSEIVQLLARRKLTICFSDLVGFTDMTDQLEPEDLSFVLNEYFTEMTAIADRYDGTVDELAGDAILTFFGAPRITDDRDHAVRAVQMARDMQAALGLLNSRWHDAGLDVALDARTGINTGVATIGNFGSEGRTKYAALGRSVNLAARLQTECPPGRILVSHATWLLAGSQVECSPYGELQLKGIQRPVLAYLVE